MDLTWELNPNRIIMKKKRIAHTVEPVIWLIASGYTMNTRPGPGIPEIELIQRTAECVLLTLRKTIYRSHLLPVLDVLFSLKDHACPLRFVLRNL